MVEPVYMGGQKFTQVRLYLSNASRRLKQNSLVTATVSVSSQSIMVPASSVYYLGSTAIVWVQKAITKEGSNIFQARAIKIGNRNKQNIEVLKGLNRGEFIAKDAAYLADSETIIQY
jgi:Cu(I)/Ag(I) efflux system membrane fusion protein